MQSLEAQKLTRTFHGRPAVDGLSFRVEQGDVLGFLGPNGAGKTTTFNIISGLLAPDSGEVRLDGRALPFQSRELRARMGVVFQHASLDTKLTGRENLAMGASLYGLRGAQARARVAWGLELVDLVARADEPVDRYSGGMRRRLELARVLLHEPEILLLDEPTAALDVAAGRKIWTQLLDLRARTKLTILLTTHDPSEAERCDRILVLDRGKTIAEGSPQELRARTLGDVIILEAAFDDDATKLGAELASLLGIEALVTGNKVMIEHEETHRLVPRIVEAFPGGRIRGVSMRPASIGDVFLRLTGKTLDGSDEPAPIGERSGAAIAARGLPRKTRGAA